jgi:TM2 domain-containing membrane protein YozV
MSAFCSNCGAPASGSFCASCGAPRASAHATAEAQALAESNQLARIAAVQEMVRRNQRHGVPALLSFFIPGLGQLVKGDILKGIATFVGFGVSVILIHFVVGVVTTPIVWLWQLYDAYTSN